MVGYTYEDFLVNEAMRGMKILGKKISAKDGSGYISVSPQLSQDVYHLHNLIAPSDHVTTSTYRKVKSSSSSGTVRSTKQRCNLTIKVTQRPGYDITNDTLRVTGVNAQESTLVKLGASHTVTIALNSSLKLTKERWDDMHLHTVSALADVGSSSELAAVALQPDGVAVICLVNEHLTVVKAKVDVSVPRKRCDKAFSAQKNAKATEKFYRQIYAGILSHVSFPRIKCCLIGGPGFSPQDFHSYMSTTAKASNDTLINDNLDRFLICSASSGHKHAVDEMLASPALQGKVADVKVARDVAVLNGFFRMIDTDEARAYYGPEEVKRAAEHGAVQTLLLSDDTLRCGMDGEGEGRRGVVELVEMVKEAGGDVRVFSSMHESGRRLAQVSGVAAVLRFPIGEGGEGEEGEREEEEEHEDDWYFTRGDDDALRSEVLVSDSDSGSDSDDDGGPTRRDLPPHGERIARDLEDMGF